MVTGEPAGRSARPQSGSKPGCVERPRVLIGIPSYCRPNGVRRLLESLVRQRGVDSHQIEVFVADNDAAGQEAWAVCKDLAAEFRWPLRCKVVEEPGISAARNAILDHARARDVALVAMLDDDEEADSDWLCKLLEMQQSTKADVVGGPVDYVLDPSAASAIKHCDAFKPCQRTAGEVSMIDATNNVLISCAALDRNGWPRFDRAFGLTGGEDKDYFTRLKICGVGFAWAPSARVREHVPVHRASVNWLIRRAYRIGNSDMHITRLHGGSGAVLASLGKGLVLLGSAPLALPLLALPSRRLWLMRKWSRSAGKLAALMGSRYREYDRSPLTGGG